MQIIVPDRVSVTLDECERCGERHEDLMFARMARPDQGRPYWAMCHTRREPILADFGIDVSNAPEPPVLTSRRERNQQEEQNNRTHLGNAVVPEQTAPAAEGSFTSPVGNARQD